MRSRLCSSLIAAGAAAAVSLFGAASAQAGGCPNANLQPSGAADMPAVQSATRCLVNRERRKRGLRSLRFNADLQQSSNWQAGDMVANQYFAHQRDGGPSFAGRITRFGYGKNSGGYALGENIAWSTTGGASPREIVSMWMHSSGHKANILRKQFKEQAISAVYVDGPLGGDYGDNGPLVIYVNQFGTRY